MFSALAALAALAASAGWLYSQQDAPGGWQLCWCCLQGACAVWLLYCLQGVLTGASHRPEVHLSDGDQRMARLVGEMQGLRRRFVPTFWAHGRFGQLLLWKVWKELWTHVIPYRCTVDVLKRPCGAEVAVKEVHGPAHLPPLPLNAPICLIFHTMTGDPPDEAQFARYAITRGYRPFILLRRGHYSPLSTPRFGMLGDVEDTHHMVTHIKAKYPQAPFIGAAGSSAGSAAAFLYTAQQKQFAAKRAVDAVVLLSSGFYVDRAAKAIHKESPLCQTFVLSSMKSFFLDKNRAILGQVEGYDAARRAKTMQEFIEKSCFIQGHASYQSFLETCCPMGKADALDVPCFALSSLDDPLCVRQAIPFERLRTSKNVALAVTRTGSHVSFKEGLFGQSSYQHEVALDFLDAVRNDRGA